MRTAATVFAVVLTGFAGSGRAQTLPVDSTYGAGAGCEILAVRGSAPAIEAGGTESFPESDAKGGEAVFVTPSHAVGSDWVCEPGTVDGEYVALLCETWGATWVPMPVARFAFAGDTLLLTMPDEDPIELERCPS